MQFDYQPSADGISNGLWSTGLMAGGWPLSQGMGSLQAYGQLTATSALTIVACNASANTKGLFVQLTAASTSDASAILVYLNGASTSGATLSTDIAVGAAGVENIVVPDVIFQDSGSSNCQCYMFPVYIKNGSRIAAKSQSVATSDSQQVAVTTIDDGWANSVGGASADAIGFASGTTNGVTIDAGTSANANGLWTQLVASSVADYAGFVISVTSTGAVVAANLQVDIGIGAGGAEVIIIDSYALTVPIAGFGLKPDNSSFISAPVLAGSRIAARARSNSITTPTRTAIMVLYGIRT